MQKTGICMRVGQFLKRNAYYVLLIACIAAVGTMVTLTVINESTNVEVQAPGPSDGNGGETDDTVNTTPGNDNNAGNDQTTGGNGNDSGNDVGNGDQTTGGDNGNVTPDPEPEVVVFCAPVAEVTGTKEYAMDTLVFSQTNNQWECHDGIDYYASAGASVSAVYGGTVVEVTSDALYGNVVTVDHGNGLSTVYANLGEVSVAQGDTLTKGQALGTVGNSGLIEIADGDHLHFEAVLNGENVDPTTYFADSDK